MFLHIDLYVPLVSNTKSNLEIQIVHILLPLNHYINIDAYVSQFYISFTFNLWLRKSLSITNQIVATYLGPWSEFNFLCYDFVLLAFAPYSYKYNCLH